MKLTLFIIVFIFFIYAANKVYRVQYHHRKGLEIRKYIERTSQEVPCEKDFFIKVVHPDGKENCYNATLKDTIGLNPGDHVEMLKKEKK